jgi:hypothetical protein
VRFFVVAEVVQESLDLFGRLQAAEDRSLAGGELVMGHWDQGSVKREAAGLYWLR